MRQQKTELANITYTKPYLTHKEPAQSAG